MRTQENGIGTHDVAAISEDHAIPIDPLAADRVEVVRGPATLRYGSQAIGGVVSVENERIPTFIPRGGFTGRILGGYSSVDDGADGAISATAGSGGFAVHADGFKREADDYDSPRGTVLNSFVESEGASLGASLIGTDGFVGVSYTRFASLYGIPGEEAEEGVDPRIDMVQDKVQAKGEWRVRGSGIEAIRFWFGASDYAHGEFAIHDPATETEFELGSRFTNKEQEARVEIQHLPVATGIGELTGAVGVHVDNRKTRGESFEGDSLLEPAHTQSAALFWFEELALTQALRLQAAARVEQTTVDGLGWSDVADPAAPVVFAGERAFVPVSGGLGLLYDLPFGVEARLNGQYVERAPDAAELFSKGMHEATGTFEIGNPFLDEEKASTVEIGLKKATGAFRFDASTYYTQYHGFIYRQLTGVACGTFSSTASCRSRPTKRSTRSCSSSAMRRSTAPSLPPSTTWRRSGTAYGASMRSTTSCAPSSRTARTCRAFRRTGSAAASTITMRTGSPASARCTPSTRTSSASTRSPRPATRSSPPS